MFWQSGFKHSSNLGIPYYINKVFYVLLYVPTRILRSFCYFTSDDVFVRAVSVREHDSSRGVLRKAHVHAIVCACAVVRLIQSPGQVVLEGDAVRACAPRPLTLATSLSATRPIV
jgi:hypothetical protein